MLPDKVSQCLHFAGQWRLFGATLAPEDPDDLSVQSPLAFSKLRLFLGAEAVLSFLVTLSFQKTQSRYLAKAAACGRCSVKTRNYDPVFGGNSESRWPY